MTVLISRLDYEDFNSKQTATTIVTLVAANSKTQKKMPSHQIMEWQTNSDVTKTIFARSKRGS